MTPVFDLENNIIYVDGILEDVTERKKNAEALEKSEEKLRRISALARAAMANNRSSAKNTKKLAPAERMAAATSSRNPIPAM